jgi:hypothetical protein
MRTLNYCDLSECYKFQYMCENFELLSEATVKIVILTEEWFHNLPIPDQFWCLTFDGQWKIVSSALTQVFIQRRFASYERYCIIS